MDLYLVDYTDYEEPNWYLFIAKDEQDATQQAEEEYKGWNNESLDGLSITDVHKIDHVGGYKIIVQKQEK